MIEFRQEWQPDEQILVEGVLPDGDWIATRNHLGYWIRQRGSDFWSVWYDRSLALCLRRLLAT